ncbi:MAG: trypsin-like peptidase domain-containing protein [Elusimicrobia bacterium]|nr:trypsin-like peptidase domain-containing protein [Elusimicrobiota bacterium]
MKNLMKTTLSAAAALLLLPFLSFAEEGKSIYGKDDRLEYFAASQDLKTLSDSVVSLWKTSSVEIAGGKAKLKTVNFGERLNLCPGEKFREQPIGAFCSGSLVGEDLVMTAGHCIKDDAGCAAAKMVFGYNIRKDGGEAVTTLPASEVYGCAKIVKRFLGGEPGSENPTGQSLGPDYALIKLDRKVTGHKPLPINRGANLKKGDAITVIGHPVGLPLKVAGGAKVRDFSKKGYFVADLDTFGGNSGSPVFNTKTKKIEGILVRGDEDFADSPAGCTTMATYEQTGGRGEDVTKISALSASIPKLPGEKGNKDAGTEELEVVEMDSSAIQAAEIAPARVITFD